MLICPVCGEPLVHSERALKCRNAHTFDIAREGYVNLLLKRSLGDSREMLLARRNFMEHGYYTPLSQTIDELVCDRLSEQAERDNPPGGTNILDVGCGEGYYLGKLQLDVAARLKDPDGHYLGLDISKEAIRLAARRYRDICFVVGDIHERLVVADSAVRVLLNIFAPRNAPEFARVVAPGGMLLIVIPGPHHLLRLRSTLGLLDIEKDKEQHVIEQFKGLFAPVEARTLEYEIRLDREDIMDNVRMTPNYWHLSERTREAIEGMEFLRTEVAFRCLVFARA